MKKLKHLKHITLGAMCFLLTLQACQNRDASKQTITNETAGICLADTIIYPVLIKNTNPNDTWTEQCLSQLQRSQLVDELFEAVYERKAKAYNYDTHTELSVSEVRAIEEQEDFSREKVGKLQFWETWYFDDQQVRMTKKVQAILLAYEFLSDTGELRGYKAAFYVKMN
ncbi:hypothetical protein [Carboxylicivirga sp. M1479]|uniref:hypothetical protein n=1 Tax=Carboxylicivirga sp. M1479 TaxID=2594476 RepID=UPI001178087F|nr:hypothetical protein [Carboxylicivirga sp. M1479]TRX66190.1 hypothetical protein FNN09_14835 [Carboxylicivirga sp. M1479]